MCIIERSRIQEQNRVYAEDSARQTVKRIKSEFDNALQRIENNAYLVSASGGARKIDTSVLKELEDNTTFDAVRFTNKHGINLTSDGDINDSSDREYFARGMRGESGLETVAESRITGQPMMVFYAPIYSDQEIAGMFLGLYFAEDYLRDMLSASYFGEPAAVFLCTRDGMVVANSGNVTYGDHLFTSLAEAGVIDEGTAEAARKAFEDGTDTALLCEDCSKTDNLCVMHLQGYDYVLVQAFPKNVTQSMVRRANMAGVMLEICLLVLFVIYVVYLIVRAAGRRKALETPKTKRAPGRRGCKILFASLY